jgi:hypothetical protein
LLTVIWKESTMEMYYDDLYYKATPPGEQMLKVKTDTIEVELRLLVPNYTWAKDTADYLGLIR